MIMKHTLFFSLGAVTGFLAIFAMILLIKYVLGKKNYRFGGCNYDERQLLARGKAYKYGYFSLLLCTMLIAISGIKMLFSVSGFFIGICISIFIFAVVCIKEDAYMSLTENAKGINAMFALIALINYATSIPVITNKKLLLDHGVLSVRCMNLTCAVLFTLILVVFNAKLIYDKKQEKDDDTL